MEVEDEVAMKKKKIETLEKDVEELKRKLEEEVRKQKLEGGKAVEELVS